MRACVCLCGLTVYRPRKTWIVFNDSFPTAHSTIHPGCEPVSSFCTGNGVDHVQTGGPNGSLLILNLVVHAATTGPHSWVLLFLKNLSSCV